MIILSKDKKRELNTHTEILTEYGVMAQSSNQYHKKGEMCLTKKVRIWKRCRECGQVGQIQYQLYAKKPSAMCLSCSKKGKRNAQYGKPHAMRGKKQPPGISKKMVATRRANDSYFHSEETRAQMSANNQGCNNPNYGHRWTEEQKQAWAAKVAQMHADGVYRRKINTKPERELKTLLDGQCIEYQQQYVVGAKVFDFFIICCALLVEVDGVYWHGKGISEDNLNETQSHNRKNDLIKNIVASKSGYFLIRIWGDEIENGFSKILDYIEGV